MGGVMLTCQRTNAAAMKFYEQCKYTVDNISPMKVVRPTLRSAPFASSLPKPERSGCAGPDGGGGGLQHYEIFSKIWCKDARAVLDKRAAQAREMWQAEHDGRVVIESAHQSAAENKALLTQ